MNIKKIFETTTQPVNGMGIWVVPKIGVPPNHPILVKFSIINQSILGYPYFWKHPYSDSTFKNKKVRWDKTLGLERSGAPFRKVCHVMHVMPVMS